MTNYYCLVAGLPDLSLEDGKLNYTVANLKIGNLFGIIGKG